MEPQQELRAFFEWLRQVTETFWKTAAEPSLADFELRGVGGSAWMPHTRWHAFSQDEVAEFQHSYRLIFPEDYRLFLTSLGAPQPWMFSAKFEGRQLVSTRRPSFTDWTNDVSVRQAIEFPLEGLLFDVENGVWLERWGPRPHTVSERADLVRSLVAQAAPLIPILGHRYIASAPASERGYLVLSVMQTDIVEYGRDLRDYLLTELSFVLGDRGRRFPEGSGGTQAARSVPFWGAFID